MLKDFLKKVPIPICGLILGLVSLGNLLFSEGFVLLGNIYSWIAICLMGIILLKIVLTMKHTINTLNDPVVASVAPTFTMAWMVICVFLNRIFGDIRLIYYIWLAIIILHFILMIYFVAVHIFPIKIELEHIYPSWFITFVGIGVIPNTSEVFIKEWGRIMIWVALFFYIILLPIIYKRIIEKEMHESAIPLITIMTAPGSLCLSGYLSIGGNKSILLISLLFVLSQFIYFCTIFSLKKLLMIRFYPSYAAFTFPLVISATAMYKIYLFFQLLVPYANILKSLFIIETFIAVLIVSYVLIRYLRFLCQQIA
ncbi:TDT family transporter [Enterococcus sp. DIV1420a]|uniref:TDT family transporter n=1 Tax=Enterococcus sp. DIV1420a TaxID=2774672 RepID=UPI003F26D304